MREWVCILSLLEGILLVVLAKPYRDHTRVETIDMYETHLTPIFGYLETSYSDNGSHFVNGDVQRLFREHGEGT